MGSLEDRIRADLDYADEYKLESVLVTDKADLRELLGELITAKQAVAREREAAILLARFILDLWPALSDARLVDYPDDKNEAWRVAKSYNTKLVAVSELSSCTCPVIGGTPDDLVYIEVQQGCSVHGKSALRGSGDE